MNQGATHGVVPNFYLSNGLNHPKNGTRFGSVTISNGHIFETTVLLQHFRDITTSHEQGANVLLSHTPHVDTSSRACVQPLSSSPSFLLAVVTFRPLAAAAPARTDQT